MQGGRMIFVILGLALGSVIFIAAVIIPWACEHDGEGIIKALRKTIKKTIKNRKFCNAYSGEEAL